MVPGIVGDFVYALLVQHPFEKLICQQQVVGVRECQCAHARCELKVSFFIAMHRCWRLYQDCLASMVFFLLKEVWSEKKNDKMPLQVCV